MRALPRTNQVLRADGSLRAFAEFGLDRSTPTWKECIIAGDNGPLPILDLGPGTKRIPWATHLMEYPEYDFDAKVGRYRRAPGDILGTHDWNWGHGTNDTGAPFWESVETCKTGLPFKNDSVGGVYAVNILEHLWDPRPLIREVARVLVPGAPFNIFVPHPDSIMYKQDLDHKSRFVLDTWDNLLDTDSHYYDKGRGGIPLEVGTNVIFAVKEDNVAICTQLLKVQSV